MQLVVTGASGFLGQAVLRCMDRAGVPCLGVCRQERAGLLRVADYGETPVADMLVHLAEANDRATVNEFGPAYEDQALRTLHALLGKGYRHVIYASSAVVYGDSSATPRKVTDPVRAVDTYTRLKLASERAVLQREGAVARLANLYGPGMAPGNVLSHILKQLGTGPAITMHALEPVRDFLWVDDAADALMSMARTRAAGLFNVGSGTGTSVRQLVAIAQAAAGSHQNVLGRRPPAEPSSLVLDIAATTAALGWEPRTSLEEGVGQLVGNSARIGLNE